MEERTQHRLPALVRLRFALNSTTTDLALPTHVALVDVLPVVLQALDPRAADVGADHDGWTVQRLAGPPLKEEATAAALNLVDGETLYLRARAPTLPPIKFDDLVDGVADHVRTSPAGWSPRRSSAMWVSFSGAIILVVIPVLALGGPFGARVGAAAVVSLVLLAGAGLASRAATKPEIGSVLAGVAACCAVAAGWFGVSWAAPDAGWPVLVAGATLAGLTTLSAGLAIVADASLIFAAAMAFSLMLCLPALVASVGDMPAQHAAAIGLVATLIASLFLPLFAFRFGGLSLPLLPGNTKELSDDIDPVPHELVVTRGALTIGYLTALCLGLAAAQLLLTVVLLLPGGGWTMLLALTTAAWLMLRSRHMGTAPQRWAVVVPALALFAGVVLRWSADHDIFLRLALVVPSLVAVGGILALAGGTLPGRRLAPYWGRGAEILETLIAVAIMPLLGAVLNVYQAVRSWTGG